MLDAKRYENISEFYTVEKTIEVVLREDRTIRIEARRHEHESPIRYSTKAYIEEVFTLQPSYPRGTTGFERKPEEVTVWVTYDLPWTARDSADDALEQALGFLHGHK